MLSGKNLKRSYLKTFLYLTGIALFFVFANVTAQTKGTEAEVTVLPDEKMLPVLIRDIAEAKQSAYIAMYMFKSYDNESDGAGLIKASLKRASARGVDVYVALDVSEDGDFVTKENRALGAELKKHGVKVIYDDPKNRMHSKCAVIDNKISYIGSHNYTNSALKYNRELTVRIVSETAAGETIKHIMSVKQGDLN